MGLKVKDTWFFSEDGNVPGLWLVKVGQSCSNRVQVAWSESDTLKLRAGLVRSGHVDEKHFLGVSWCSARRRRLLATAQGGSLRDLVHRGVLLFRAVQGTFESGSSCSAAAVTFCLWSEALQPDGIFGVLGAGKQDGHVFTELGAEAKVDQGVVEAGGLGKEASEDACQVGHMETAG